MNEFTKKRHILCSTGLFKTLPTLLFLLVLQFGFSQTDSTKVSKCVNKKIIVGSSMQAVTLLGLNELWYKEYPRSKFHFFNDNAQWLQMDKAGHFMTSYYLSLVGFNAIKRCGTSSAEALRKGFPLGLVFLTSVEVLDGFSDRWGFSTGDAFANLAGSGFFLAQELAWQEQRIEVKYSFHRTPLAQARPNLLGDGLAEEWLKDYNGQTYWFSVNVAKFAGADTKWPKWLLLSAGYGVEGLLGGRTNPEAFQYLDRRREYFLSLDLDLSQIEWRSKFMLSFVRVFGWVKFPAPAIGYSKGKVRGYWLYF